MPKYEIKTRKQPILVNGHVIRPYRSMVIEQETRPLPVRGMRVKRVG